MRGTGGVLRAPDGPLMVGNSGTTARFLTVAAALADGPVVIDGNPRMRERPIDDLTRALVALGVPVEILGRDGCPPVRVGGWRAPRRRGRGRRQPLEPVRLRAAALGPVRRRRT